MRNVNHRIHWFESESDGSLQAPPPAPWPSEKGLRHYDLYIHRREGRSLKTWMFIPHQTDEHGIWKRLRVGEEVDIPGLAGSRVFVVNSQGKPSFVLKGTVAKLYNELEQK